ncbi:toxin-like protein 14 [Nephila pilipes]|uniref:Toxin-like protein 14 n=1 Tax=Nephila pilipes TaxID=299642 RepID=A0A8X6QXV2_NEPPI|nr:toxin-like protein 14 [Nephila pilipes]
MFFNEKKCIDENREVHEIGSLWYNNLRCEQLQCIRFDGILYIQGYGCGQITPPKPCFLVPGKGLNYPECCHQVNCPHGVN